MNGLHSFILEVFNLPADQMATLVVGGLLSPAKLVAFVIGAYKALSLNYVDPTWKKLSDPQDGEDA